MCGFRVAKDLPELVSVPHPSPLKTPGSTALHCSCCSGRASHQVIVYHTHTHNSSSCKWSRKASMCGDCRIHERSGLVDLVDCEAVCSFKGLRCKACGRMRGIFRIYTCHKTTLAILTTFTHTKHIITDNATFVFWVEELWSFNERRVKLIPTQKTHLYFWCWNFDLKIISLYVGDYGSVCVVWMKCSKETFSTFPCMFYTTLQCYVNICRGTQLHCQLHKSQTQLLFSMDIAFAVTAACDTLKVSILQRMSDAESLTAEDLKNKLYNSLREKGLVDALKVWLSMNVTH